MYKGGQVKDHRQPYGRWNKGKQDGRVQMSANACSQNEGSSSAGGITAFQLEQLLKLLPIPSKRRDDESEDEMETNYAEMIKCNLAQSESIGWIIDSGATHHMTGSISQIENAVKTAH